MDIVEYSLATKMLESKLQILNALNIDTGSDENSITLNVKGSGKSLIVNLQKLREAITIQDVVIEEKTTVAQQEPK